MRRVRLWTLCATLAMVAAKASADPDAYEAPSQHLGVERGGSSVPPPAQTAHRPWLHASVVPASPPAPVLPEFEWHEGDRVAAGYHLETRPAMGLVLAGAFVFGVPYVGGLFGSASDRFDNQKGWLFVPGVGPWLTLGLRKRIRKPCDTEVCQDEAFDAGVKDAAGDIGLILSGLAQTTGLILAGAGFASVTTWQVPNTQVHVTPAVSGDLAGAVVNGTF